MREMVAVVFVYLGFGAALLGVISLVRPLAFLGIASRRHALLVLFASLLLLATGWLLPATETRVAVARTHLDEIVPVYQFEELHTIHVRATPAQVMRAVRAVTVDEIRLFRTLTWIRRFGRPGPENILNPSAHRPILDVATSTSFAVLADEPDHEVVVGTIVVAPDGYRAGLRARRAGSPAGPLVSAADIAAATGPGFAKAVMNFRTEPAGTGGTLLSTETRVFATDPTSRRMFARYWRTIYPGSALIRRMWLRAIRNRAEAG